MFFMMFLLVLSLMMMMLTISNLLKIKKNKQREKSTPFECGFDPAHKMRSSFSLRFFLITILFLVFDVETAIILPIPLTSTISSTWSLLNTSLTIFIILSMGIIFEWTQGALDWNWTYI